MFTQVTGSRQPILGKIFVNRTRCENFSHIVTRASSAAAQDAGIIPPGFTPVQLLALIQSLSTSWATMNPEFATLAGNIGRRERRRAVVQAAARVVGVAASGS
jgi:hypothetical protein